MRIYLKSLHKAFFQALIFLLSFSLIFPVPLVHAQLVSGLPKPGVMVRVTPVFSPVTLKGLNIHPDNPFVFDFIVDSGTLEQDSYALKAESQKLIKYFLTALTIPEQDLWVNLSPYEQDRIIPKNFGLTEMGKEFLAQDYLLKQLTASLVYPEQALGQKFWKRVYQKLFDTYGTTEVPLDTFNKVWIVADKADIFQNSRGIFIVSSHLKVMTDVDYLANEKNREKHFSDPASAHSRSTQLSVASAEAVRDILIPEIEREVNEGRSFAKLRQIYHALILATWYKDNLKESILGQLYVARSKIGGIETRDVQISQKIYDQYLAAFKKGIFNYIKEEPVPESNELAPRKYFSGGVHLDAAMAIKQGRSYAALDKNTVDHAMKGDAFDVSWRAQPSAETSTPGLEQLRQIANPTAAASLFRQPQSVRDMILKHVKPRAPTGEEFQNRPTIYMFPTKFCPVRCEFCYFSSPPGARQEQSNTFTAEGIRKFIELSDHVNPAGIVVSGGGDPFLVVDHLVTIVSEARTSKITLVTSGYWAKNISLAEKVLERIYEAAAKNPHRPEIVVRASIDVYHEKNVSLDNMVNLVQLFVQNRERFQERKMSLMFHSLLDDEALGKLENMLDAEGLTVRHKSVIDKVQTEVVLENGMKFDVRRVDIFHSDPRVDLRDLNSPVIQRNLLAFRKKNLYKATRDNGRLMWGIQKNAFGQCALDYLMNYDGLVELWASSAPDARLNIYQDDAANIRERVLSDIISLAHVEKGILYLENIIEEVNPLAPIRAKAVNIPDWYSRILLREAKDRLYLSIRLLQEYVKEGRITADEVAAWPEELQKTIPMTRDELIGAYNSSEYSIVTQAMEEFDGSIGAVDNLVELYQTIEMGHYFNVTGQQLKSAIVESSTMTLRQKAEFFLKVTKLSFGLALHSYAYRVSKLSRQLEALDRTFLNALESNFLKRQVLLASYAASVKVAIKSAANASIFLGSGVPMEPVFSPISLAAQGEFALAGSPANFFSILTEAENRERGLTLSELIVRTNLTPHTIEADMRVLRAAGLITRDNVDGMPVFQLAPALVKENAKIQQAQKILNVYFQKGAVAKHTYTVSSRSAVVEQLIETVWPEQTAGEPDIAKLELAKKNAQLFQQVFQLVQESSALLARDAREESLDIIIRKINEVPELVTYEREDLLLGLIRDYYHPRGVDFRNFINVNAEALRFLANQLEEIKTIQGGEGAITVALLGNGDGQRMFLQRQLLKLRNIQVEYVGIDSDTQDISGALRLNPGVTFRQMDLVGLQNEGVGEELKNRFHMSFVDMKQLLHELHGGMDREQVKKLAPDIIAGVSKLARDNGRTILWDGLIPSAPDQKVTVRLSSEYFEALKIFAGQNGQPGVFGEVVPYQYNPATHEITLSKRHLGQFAVVANSLIRAPGVSDQLYSTRIKEAAAEADQFFSLADYFKLIVAKDLRIVASKGVLADRRRESLASNITLVAGLGDYLDEHVIFYVADKKTVSESDRAQVYGGIDFDASNLQITSSGDKTDFSFPLQSQSVRDIQFDGINPVIINIVPVESLSLFFGDKAV